MGSEEAAGPLAPWLGFLRGIEQQCQGAFYAWGKIVVGNARAVQAVWLLVVVVCAGLGFGAVGVHFEDDPTSKWSVLCREVLTFHLADAQRQFIRP